VGWTYLLCWAAPVGMLSEAAWVLIGRPRAIATGRLRDPLGRLEREQLDEITAGLRQLVEDQVG
jgi:hypothetical protein